MIPTWNGKWGADNDDDDEATMMKLRRNHYIFLCMDVHFSLWNIVHCIQIDYVALNSLSLTLCTCVCICLPFSSTISIFVWQQHFILSYSIKSHFAWPKMRSNKVPGLSVQYILFGHAGIYGKKRIQQRQIWGLNICIQRDLSGHIAGPFSWFVYMIHICVALWYGRWLVDCANST